MAKSWDKLVDRIFELDKDFPLIGSSGDPDEAIYSKDYNECHNPEGPGGGQFCSEGDDLSDKMVKALEEKGGFTFTAKGKTPEDGWAVGGYGTMPVFEVADFRKDAVVKFMADNAPLLKTGKYHVGGWVDGGKVYLDVTKVFPEGARNAAIKQGRSKNQIAITNLTKIRKGDFEHAFVKTGGTGKPLSLEPQARDAASDANYVMFDPDATAEEIYETLAAILKGSREVPFE